MKTILSSCLLLFVFLHLNAQVEYTVTFTSENGATIIDSVIVVNLTQDTSITIKNGEQLKLINISTLQPAITNQNNDIIIYPNPVINTGTIEITNYRAENIYIQIADISGKVVLSTSKFLDKGRHKFQINGLKQGLYLINLTTLSKSISNKIISINKQGANPQFKYIGQSEKPVASILKAGAKLQTSGYMPFYPGDYILYQGYSSNGEYWVADSITGNVNIIFHFTPCTDIDNNKYPVVRIGQQFWIARNLRATHYSDGTSIPYVPDPTNWKNLTESGIGYCWYQNDSISYAKTYGALYTWNAATRGAVGSNSNPSGIQGVCPAGWHLPSDAEWVELINYLGGFSVAGGKLKEAGYKHWMAPNIEATNKTGFTAVPGGYRSYKGNFSSLGSSATWWTANIYWWTCMNNYYGGVDRDNHDFSLGTGFSVRCVKD